MVSIYCLADPVTRQIRYVGQTSEPLPARLARHLKEARGGNKLRRNRWIRQVLKSGRVPKVCVLEKCHSKDRFRRERHHIERLRKAGAALTNRSKVTLSSRRKMRLGQFGRKHSQATLRKMSIAQRRAWRDPAIRAARITPRIGHTYSKATLRRMSLAASGRVISPAQRRKISRSLTGWKQSRKTRLKRSRSARLAWARGAWAHRKSPRRKAPSRGRHRGVDYKS
jgi:GIY-YIG catalytic domain/NUMOD3 motif